jgi:hypothetical protein
MSQSFRPVKTIWGPHSDEFVSHDDLIETIETLAEKVGSRRETTEVGELTEIWIDKGKEFLDFCKSSKLYDAYLEINDTDGDLKCLLANLESHAEDWKLYLDDSDGSLRLWLD